MKILLAIDGSKCSDAAVMDVAGRPWPPDCKLKIMSVVESPYVSSKGQEDFKTEFQSVAEQAAYSRAQAIIDKAVTTILAGDNKSLAITAKILTGPPNQVILDEAEKWDADLIIVGSHGYREEERALLGSVSQVVSMHAKCSVEIVRDKKR